MKLRTNSDRLVKLAVAAKVAQPILRGYQVSPTGATRIWPVLGGIVYNVKCGDPAVGWVGDHIEPAAAIELARTDGDAIRALNTCAQIGNPATVTGGAAKGARGTVTGKHGGIEHVHVDFAQRDLEKLAIGDSIQIEAWGLGLELTDFPEVKVMNIDPGVLAKLKLASAGGKLVVPVAMEIPAEIMGSGLGQNQCQSGDYDIQLSDPASVKKWGLDRLRLGDFVAVIDADQSYGRIFRKGAVSVGVVVHADCVGAGHGPGLTTVFTSARGRIQPRVARGANLADILRIGRARGGRR
jgi:hypothetical protein